MGSVESMGMERLQSFGKAVAEAMLASGLRQVDLAASLGAGQATISEWKRGVVEPSPDRVFALERALGVAPGDLSVYLGYLPSGSQRSFREAVLASELPPRIRRALLLILEEIAQIDGGG